MIKASVIIPNWNGENLLPECLSSLNRQNYQDFEIIIVDNNSKDDSIEFTKKNFPEVRILKLKKNFGFAKAINEGVKIAKGKYLLFLNNDTEVDKNWITELVKCANSHPEVISVNSKLLNFFKRNLIDGVGITINEVGQAKSIGWQEIDKNKFQKSFYILGATGGASLFKKDLFIKIGMFDESYFMYSEEVDFAFRAQFLGYKSIYCPSAIVYHKHKASAKKNMAKLEYWQFRNMTQTIIKDFPTKILTKDHRLLKIFLVHFNTIFYQLKKGYIWPPILTEIWLLCNLPRLIKERIRIQSNIKVELSYIENFLTKKTLKSRF